MTPQHDRRHGEDVVSDEPDSQGETLARARGDSRGQRPADHLTHRPRNASRVDAPSSRRRRRVALAIIGPPFGHLEPRRARPLRPDARQQLDRLANASYLIIEGRQRSRRTARCSTPRKELTRPAH